MSMSEATLEATTDDLPPFCADGCGERVTPGLVFGKPRKYIRGHGPQAKGTKAARTPGKSPTIDELKAAAEEPGTDRKPGSATKGKRSKAKTPPAEDTPYRPGVIARGMNKLYARVGRVVRAMDNDLGVAIIETTVKYSEDDVTVGEAWDEYAKTNPKVRRVLTKLITGGTMAQLVYAHAPIFLALLMKESIARRIPMGRLLAAWFSPAEGAFVTEPPEDGDDQGEQANPLAAMFGDLNGDDMQQAMNFASGLMANMMNGGGRAVGGTGRAPIVEPENVELIEQDGEVTE